MAGTEAKVIDSAFGVPNHLAEAAEAKPLVPVRKVRTPIWQRIISLSILGGITGLIAVALAVSLIGLAVLTLMLLERAIG
ncbi:MAG: hypothetical protein HKN03_11150 [Acidimicrobiales bacterium]|nr:hypothetical protein [Acidimicrobiales bacterium]